MTPVIIVGFFVALYLYCAIAAGYAASKPSPADEVTIQLQQMRDLMLSQLNILQAQQREIERTRLDLLQACGQRRPLWEPNPR